MCSFRSRIVTGDTVEVLPKLSRKHKFDVVIADPPYNIGKDFGSNWDQMPLENYVSWTKEWLGECLDLLKDTGVVYIYGFPEILAHVSVLFPVDEQRWLQWHYTNKTVPGSTFWQRSHESILCLWKPGWKRPQLEIDQIREPYTEQFLRNAAGKERAGTPSRFGSTGKRTIYVVHENGAMPRDVIKVPALAGGAGRSERWFLCRSCGGSIHPPAELKLHKDHDVLKHPTQKPKELTRRLLKSRVNGSGGRVLIPFAGSGSECVVAQELGISFLGIEINPEYASFAWQWLYTEKTGAANVQIDWQDAPEIRERFEEIS